MGVDDDRFGVRGTLDGRGTPLRDLTFVVFDLETTGGRPDAAAITETGAVKVRGGEVLGEFATLVDPDGPVPPFITVLTGITDQMVASAPPLSSVLPSFLEFARGCVLVAHNAPFDVGFLRAACASLGYPWPSFASVDTADLARRVLTRDETPNCKLATLARVLRIPHEPRHRALADARATVDVLHALLERLGSLGVETLEELSAYARAPSRLQRAKRHLADGIPSAPGVYVFEDASGRPLYVGRSGDLRSRVRSYFTGAETRGRVRDMLGLAERVTPIVCATGLEAEVRELRLIAGHKPPYNRRSRFPERSLWLKLTVEPFPRLAITRSVRDDRASYLGPFPSTRLAQLARDALHEAFPLRECTLRLSPRRLHSACALAELGRCGAPCEGREPVDAYAVHVSAASAAMTGDVRPVVDAMRRRIELLCRELRYEDAAAQRDRLAAFVRTAARMQRLAALASCRQLVAARPAFGGGFELSVVRHGRLAAAGVAPPNADPRPYLHALVASAEAVRPGPGPTPCASAEEMECVLRWLEAPGARLIDIDGAWCSPAHGAEGVRAYLAAVYRGLHDLARMEADVPRARPRGSATRH
ncbi:MAG: DEDD exonuclease domain-containing protein [Streptosporangiaceae bacterium]